MVELDGIGPLVGGGTAAWYPGAATLELVEGGGGAVASGTLDGWVVSGGPALEERGAGAAVQLETGSLPLTTERRGARAIWKSGSVKEQRTNLRQERSTAM